MILLAQRDHRRAGGAELYAARLSHALLSAGHRIHHLDIHGRSTELPPAPTAAASPIPALLAWALVCRGVRKIAYRYAHVVLAYGDGPPLPVRSTVIHHAPWLFSTAQAHVHALHKSPGSARSAYIHICRLIAGGHDTSDAPHRLANSHWTSAHLPHVHSVLYPPLDVRLHEENPHQRPPISIVSLGRISPEKRLSVSIALVNKLRADGHPAHLTIAGRAQGRFAHRFLARHREQPAITLAPNIDADTRLHLLSRTRYGYHPAFPEHFGISIAEMIAAGVLPLIAPDGGATELVPDPALHAATPDQAAQKIIALEKAGPAHRSSLLRQLRSGPAFLQATAFDHHARLFAATLGSQTNAVA
ncbi:MAG: glycosyltransferase family 4 protein [Marivivens sp.]|nr:glycosyltransferase family 4 protein [Marivivens sp.]